MLTTALAAAISCVLLAQQDAQQPFPHIRIDTIARTVEFDASVPITLDDPDAPFVYLELLACIPDTKEHETLVVTDALPSHIHAALLLLGLEPGSPGEWEWRDDALKSIPPSGPRVRIEFLYTDAEGNEAVAKPQDWIINAETQAPFPVGDWVFAGSRMIEWQGEEFYDADGAGTLIGLTTFGSEVLAWPEMISPEASIEEPVWVANPLATPPMGTEVVVRLTAVR
jgi:hypothetical protein